MTLSTFRESRRPRCKQNGVTNLLIQVLDSEVSIGPRDVGVGNIGVGGAGAGDKVTNMFL